METLHDLTWAFLFSSMLMSIFSIFTRGKIKILNRAATVYLGLAALVFAVWVALLFLSP